MKCSDLKNVLDINRCILLCFREQNCNKKIVQTDASGCFIVGKDSIPMRLWQYTDADNKLRYSLISALDNNPKAEEAVSVLNLSPLTVIKVEETEDQLSDRRTVGCNANSCADSSTHLHEATTFVCDKCNVKFPIQSMLTRHKMTHNVRSWLRDKCLKKINVHYQKINVQRHSKQLKTRKRSEGTKYVCTFCDFCCNKSATLDTHIRKKHGKDAEKTEKKLNCAICGFECSDKANLNKHMCKHRKKGTMSFACDMCDFECKKGTTLASHLAQNHKKSKENLSTYAGKSHRIKKCSYTPSKKTDASVSSSYSYETAKDTALISYQNSKGLIKEEVFIENCSETPGIADGIAKKPSQENVEEHCDLCDFTCAKKSTLYSHKRRHKVENVSEVYACNECGFKTGKKSSLYSHIKRKHKEPQSCDVQPELFYCSQCDYKNKNKYELKIHVARKHSDVFKFSCETCGKKFKVKGDLTNHIRFSHREQPVICDVCGKTCLNSNSLYVHQKFAHYKAKYECQICKRRMVSQENLNEHMLRQHEHRDNVVCEECGKTFSRNSRLKVHMRIHTGDKPYNCTICSKSFARRTALKQHLLIHTGIRPYVCDICGKAFTQKPGLISHRKSHPGSHPPLPRVLIDHILNDYEHIMNA